MKKYLFSLLSLLVLMPLNAQKVVKYITFYPIPYGSHQTLTVEKVGSNEKTGKMFINASDDSTTSIIGSLSISAIDKNASDYDGNLTVSNNGTDVLQTTGQIKSGNDISPITSYGKTTVYDTAATNSSVINNMDSISIISVADTAILKADSTVDSQSLANLPACTQPVTWSHLRLEGSEECKLYLLCGSGGTGDGCSVGSSNCAAGQCWNGTGCDSNPGSAKKYNGRCYYVCRDSAWTCITGSGWNCANKDFDPKQTGTYNRWVYTSAPNNSNPAVAIMPASTCKSSTVAYFSAGGTDATSACKIESGSDTPIDKTCDAYYACSTTTLSGFAFYVCQQAHLTCTIDYGIGCE